MKTRRNRLRSFVYAGNGFVWLAGTQWNFKFHLIATISAVACGFFFNLRSWEWVAILICMGMVWMAELINTSIEFMLNKLHPEMDESIGKAKDLAAAAVLTASLVALLVGTLVFMPYLISYLKV